MLGAVVSGPGNTARKLGRRYLQQRPGKRRGPVEPGGRTSLRLHPRRDGGPAHHALAAPGPLRRGRDDLGTDQAGRADGPLGNGAPHQRRAAPDRPADGLPAARRVRGDHRRAHGRPRHHRPSPNGRNRPGSESPGPEPRPGDGYGQPDRAEHSGPPHGRGGAAPHRRRRAHPGRRPVCGPGSRASGRQRAGGVRGGRLDRGRGSDHRAAPPRGRRFRAAAGSDRAAADQCPGGPSRVGRLPAQSSADEQFPRGADPARRHGPGQPLSDRQGGRPAVHRGRRDRRRGAGGLCRRRHSHHGNAGPAALPRQRADPRPGGRAPGRRL